MGSVKSKFFKCTCECKVLHLEYDPEWGLEIAMFERPVAWPLSNRIRLAWNALCGRPYTDMVILDNQQINDLAEYMLQVKNYDSL